jgi:hypothetical protein
MSDFATFGSPKSVRHSLAELHEYDLLPFTKQGHPIEFSDARTSSRYAAAWQRTMTLNVFLDWL